MFSPCKDSQNSLYCTTFQLFNSLHFVSSFSHTYFKIFEFLFWEGGAGEGGLSIIIASLHKHI